MLQSLGNLVFMIYRSFLRPILFRLSPETAHDFALTSLSFFLGAKPIRQIVASRNQITTLDPLKRFGLEFRNPIGLAAGFDKNGRYVRELGALGFGFIEVGSVTNEAQPGSPKPRVFRLPKDRALINRLGFNNIGAERVADHLRRHRPDCILGVNIGKSRSVPIEEAIPDYLASFDAVYDVADYIAVNVSSPNTPNLRELQQHELLADLLSSLQERNAELSRRDLLKQPKPLLLKIAPDLSEAEIESIVEVALRTNVSGIIATNTTIKRDGLRTSIDEVRACGAGGLSGAPLRDRSNRVISLIIEPHTAGCQSSESAESSQPKMHGRKSAPELAWFSFILDSFMKDRASGNELARGSSRSRVAKDFARLMMQ